MPVCYRHATVYYFRKNTQALGYRAARYVKQFVLLIVAWIKPVFTEQSLFATNLLTGLHFMMHTAR